MGPVIGTTIYGFAGYELTFYILAGILCLSFLTAIFLLPHRINKYKNDKPNEVILDQNANARPSIQGPRPQGIAERHSVDMVGLAKVSERYSRRSHVMMAQVTFKIFFTNLRAMTAIVSAMFAMIFMLFYEPVFTPYIVAQGWIAEEKVGYTLAIGCFTYAVGSPLVGLLCSKMQRKYITLMAFFLCGASLFVFGPSPSFGFNPSLAFTLVGIGMLGFSVAFLFVPLLPEIISSVAEKEGLENSPFLADKASGIYNGAYGVGNCLAPIIGGAITAAKISKENDDKTKGFPFTCDVMAFASIGFGVLYFLLAILPGLISGNNASKYNKREDKLTADLAAGAVDNSLTIEFEANRAGQLNDSNRQTGTTK
jgi:MFS family permease